MSNYYYKREAIDTMMTKIGIIAMSAKPFHAGHQKLIELAVRECDEVQLFVGLADRDNISGAVMAEFWKQHIEATLPASVKVTYGGSPITNAWKVLGQASEAQSPKTEYIIYSDPDDLAKNFPQERLAKYVGWLLNNGLVILRPVNRDDTVDVSGTEMRGYLAQNDKGSFMKKLPRGIDGNAYWAALQAGSSALAEAAAKARSRRIRK